MYGRSVERSAIDGKSTRPGGSSADGAGATLAAPAPTSSDLSCRSSETGFTAGAALGSAGGATAHGFSEAIRTKLAKKDGLSTTAKHARKATVAAGPLNRSAAEKRCLSIEISHLDRGARTHSYA
jgi:hypothetical protein